MSGDVSLRSKLSASENKCYYSKLAELGEVSMTRIEDNTDLASLHR